MRGRRTLFTALGVALALGVGAPAWAQVATPQVKLDGALVPQFAQPLPVLYVPALGMAPAGIPVALGTEVPDATQPNGVRQDITLSMCEFTTSVLPAGTPVNPTADLLTSVWGYREGACPDTKLTAVPDSYIGPVVVAQRGVPTRVTYQNRLGDSSLTNVLAYKYSTDLTLMWADPLSTGDTTVAPYPPTGTNTATLAADGTTVLSPMDYSPLSGVATSLLFPPEENMCAHNAVPGALPLGICAGNYFGPIPATPHLHGGEIPAVLDGGPDAWWTESGLYGHGYYSFDGFNQVGSGNAVYTYTNTQEAAPIWFHDHVLGATRLNVYAGIAGAYMITDSDAGPLNQGGNLAAGLLPLGLDTNGNGTTDVAPGSDELLIPVVLQDRAFDTDGELYFDSWGSGFGTTDTHPYWVPEFVGDTIAVNGKVWPFLDVAPKRYRLLFINGSNARAYEIRLQVENGGKKVKNPKMWVIANDQGYLDLPVALNSNNNQKGSNLTIMPGERYEVIVDFAGYAGTQIVMTNTAAIPYPFGGAVIPVQDGTIMQFRVNLPAPAADLSYNPQKVGAVRTTPIVRLVDPVAGAPLVPVHKTRRLTLNEAMDPITGAPLELLMNNTKYGGEGNLGGAIGPRADFDPVTTRWNTSYYSELPVEGETEIWEIINFSADAHPIHPHLVAFQIVNRQPFDGVAYNAAYDNSFPAHPDPVTGLPVLGYDPGAGPPLDYNCGLGLTAQLPVNDLAYNGAGCVLGGNPDPTPFLLGPVVPPSPAEQGWKDTAISYPGEILRILIRYAPTAVPPGTAPDVAASAYEFGPDDGHGYVWHCHIIDHEDNEMMRPYNVLANVNAPARTFNQGVQY
ncbi:MAG: multicopper oxidase domain-containing protein [Deferrisomatales bacterium]|nr:multicopper oxidase domain-containing protein [Deferrisomatales bacterium]